MILVPIDFTQEETDELLAFDHDIYKNTWDYYFKQYKTAFLYLLQVAKKKKYYLNRMFTPFLFLLRHSLELRIKKYLASKDIEVLNEHSLKELLGKCDCKFPEGFLDKIQLLDPDGEGSFFKYYEEKGGRTYADYLKKIFGDKNYNQRELLPLCNYLLKLDNQELLVDDKILRWELTAHVNECTSLGQVRTQYDFMISMLLEAVKNKEILLENIYLPLSFLCRHSIEIALKCNLYDIFDKFSKNKKKKIKNYHSISELFKFFDEEIIKGIENVPDKEFKRKLIKGHKRFESLKDLIKNLDDMSFITRFPFDKEGKEYVFNFELLKPIYHLYRLTDSYLTFGITSLVEQGYMTFSKEKMAEIFGE